MRYFLFVSLIWISIASCDNAQTKKMVQEPVGLEISKTDPVKNIIFLIGDGMGLTQITAGMYANGNKTSLEKCKSIGFHKSHAFDKLVTDSAAGATAFACGVKTYNGAIGVDSDTVAVETILEIAKRQGKKTGLVATSTIVHATPASFFAHNEKRKNYEQIATELTNGNVDFFIGGGKNYFTNRSNDSRNLYEEFAKDNYVISDFFEKELAEINIDKSKKFGYLTSNDDPLPVAQGRDYLPLASDLALEYLDHENTDGFFLMIEGSQIDWGGHANDPDYVVTEFQEFDKIIAKALSFADANPNTLVLITADHETGGLAIQPESTMDSLAYAFTSTYHTGTMIPVFAYGKKAEMFGGIYENTEIFNKLKEAFGF